MIENLITYKKPPENRKGKTDGDLEALFSEAAVMLSFALNLFSENNSLKKVEVHPDGEHGKQFDIRNWLETNGFRLTKPEGKTKYGGTYENGNKSVYVSLRSGLGDVVANIDGKLVVAECKGGIINTRHSGQKSKLRRGLCEAVGLLMSRDKGESNYAVVPYTKEAKRLAEKMKRRCKVTGIEIILVDENGSLYRV